MSGWGLKQALQSHTPLVFLILSLRYLTEARLRLSVPKQDKPTKKELFGCDFLLLGFVLKVGIL